MVTWPSQSQSQIGILLLWILCAFMCNPGIWGLKVQCNEMDRQKLVSFKQQVIDSSGMLSTWSDKQDCCRWAGVECDHLTHRVTNLSLPCLFEDDTKCLAGEFSLSNLFELEFLNYLNLGLNHLLFTPGYAGNYSSKLLHLDLSSKHPDAQVDDLTWLVHAHSLEYLDLSGIRIQSSRWLQSINMLPSLLVLHMRKCQLQDTNSYLGFVNFTLLEILDLSLNNFYSDRLPKWLFNLSHVQYLSLQQNFFHGHIPDTILNLRELKSLNLYENELEGPIPNWLSQLENLQYLYLFENFFVGPIPETLGNLSFLTDLSLSNNLLNGSLPKSLNQLSKLETLKVEDNLLTGVISEKNFLQFSNLQILSLGSPSLTFQFDPHWIPSFQLQRVYLGYVHPKLPVWLYTQKFVKLLIIYNSSLSSEDQDKFWNFVAEVQFLHLSYNSITGNLSRVLLNSKVTLLTGNNLSGGFPRISPNVTLFSAESNSFSGDLSSLLCHKMEGKSRLLSLAIYNNRLSGGLTECWANWKSLVHIHLPNNSLTGKISESISLLSNLKSLHLDQNNLFGYIPASLKNCQKLTILNLGENKFSGDIPYWVSPSVKVLMLRSNQISGNISPQLCQLSSLLVLDIADNRLSGTIPNCLHNISAMVSHNTAGINFFLSINVTVTVFHFWYTFLLHIKGNQLGYKDNQKLIMRMIDLSHNNLIGAIPLEIFSLDGLQSLNLSNNQLTGRIPQKIGNLKQLECLDLSRNLIGGEIPQSMSELSFLGYLNLSFNSFTGQIPPMAQFQRFDA